MHVLNSGRERGVLVTGGAGYLGSVLVRQLLESGHRVVVLDNLMYSQDSLSDLHDQCLSVIVGDKRDRNTVRQAVHGVDTVVDLAAIVGDPACQFDRTTCIDTNLRASLLLAEEAAHAGVARFVFASSCSVYGNSGDHLVDERTTPHPLSCYAKAKLQCERGLHHLDTDMERVVLRLSTLCGPSPRMRFDLVLNRMTASAYCERAVTVYGGRQWRPLLDVRDAARAIVHLMDYRTDSPFELFNVGHESGNMRICDLAGLVAEVVGDVEVNCTGSRHPLRSYRVDFGKLLATGFVPRFRLHESVRDVLSMLTDGVVTDPFEPTYSNTHHGVAAAH